MRRTAVLGLVVGLALPLGSPGFDTVAAQPAQPPERTAAAKPLAGKVVVLDPGHQLGNRNFPRQVNRPVPAGRGQRKACNTTGTATAGGFAEATFTWRVARLVKKRLRAQGARVVLTRHSNRHDRWGPCVDERGRAGNRARADLMVSIHADGTYASGARGFHVITVPGRTASARLARELKASLRRSGIPVANYIAGGDGLDERTDLGTLNLSRVPTAMVELGNMRGPRDARRMTTARGRASYARALGRAIATELSDTELSDNGSHP